MALAERVIIIMTNVGAFIFLLIPESLDWEEHMHKTGRRVQKKKRERNNDYCLTVAKLGKKKDGFKT